MKIAVYVTWTDEQGNEQKYCISDHPESDIALLLLVADLTKRGAVVKGNHASLSRWTEASPVLARDNKGLNHLGLHEVAVEEV